MQSRRSIEKVRKKPYNRPEEQGMHGKEGEYLINQVRPYSVTGETIVPGENHRTSGETIMMIQQSNTS